MPPSQSEIQEQLNRIEDKFDALRKELMASFVLKEVFDMYSSGLRIEINALKEGQTHSRDRWARYIAYTSGLVSIGYMLNSLFHWIH